MSNKDTIKEYNKKLVGLTIKRAMDIVSQDGMTLRISQKDGYLVPVTRDVKPNRVNVNIRDGKVIEVLRLG